MSRTELDREFLGAEWDCGYSFGATGADWLRAITQVRRELGRDPSGLERGLFAAGWRAGAADHAAYRADMAACEVPFCAGDSR